MKYWLNIDIPTGFAVLHRETCASCKPLNQRHKGINGLSHHGGWFEFESKEEAYAFYRADFPQIKWRLCKKCIKNME
ncbi:MAG: hypothetical protein ABIJ47_16335 [Candidatus Bathyarchaeota archaeon]